MLDATCIIRTILPAYPATVNPGGKSIPATMRFSPGDATTCETSRPG